MYWCSMLWLQMLWVFDALGYPESGSGALDSSGPPLTSWGTQSVTWWPRKKWAKQCSWWPIICSALWGCTWSLVHPASSHRERLFWKGVAGGRSCMKELFTGMGTSPHMAAARLAFMWPSQDNQCVCTDINLHTFVFEPKTPQEAPVQLYQRLLHDLQHPTGLC